MSDLGRMKFFLGVEVSQTDAGIFICQKKYAREVLERFNMENNNTVTSPIVPGNKLTKDSDGKSVDVTIYKQMIGCLMYLTATRPDLMYVVCLTSRYMERPTQAHLVAVKRILRYVKGTVNLGILYRGINTEEQNKIELTGFTDSDYAGDSDDRRSTSGYVFMMNSAAV